MRKIKPKFIDTGAGGQIVILTRAEYDELVARAEEVEEDAELGAIYDARTAEVLTRPTPFCPPRSAPSSWLATACCGRCAAGAR